MPGCSDLEVADSLSAYFNTVSQEFSALEPEVIPTTFDEALPALEVWQVAGRFKHFKKPKSLVEGDVFPALVTLFADFFAVQIWMRSLIKCKITR